MTVPVYLFTGFLESGKTTLIKETLLDTGFNTGERTLLLACEEGMEDYDDDFLTKTNTALVTVDNEAAMSYEFLKKCDSLIEPDRVMIEFNGTWNLNSFMDVEYPFDWLLVQILSTVDASTFEVYLNNMRSLIYDQLLHSETIIFNRCDETTKKLYLRNNIKAINKGAQLIYETRDGQIVELGSRRDVFENPLHPYTKRLMSAVPIPDPSRRTMSHTLLTGEIPSPVRSADYEPVVAPLKEVSPGHFVSEEQVANWF